MQVQTKKQQKTLNEWLHICNQNLGKIPRPISWFEQATYLSSSAPAWAIKDELQTFFKNQAWLMKQGHLVWGSAVQANVQLFSPGIDSCPADVVYPTKQILDFDPEVLKVIALKIYDLKGTQPDDKSLIKVANHLTNELERVFGLFVPSSFCENIPCGISTIFIARKHLPNGYLSQTIFPLMVSPEQPKIAMILPSRYWPTAMVEGASRGCGRVNEKKG
jgi:hypothetical protein